MTDKLDITKLNEVASRANGTAYIYRDRALAEFRAIFTPAVAVVLCGRVRELEQRAWRERRR